MGILLALSTPARAIDFGEFTVVTMARDGSWGVATAGSLGQAIADAIRDCNRMAAARSDCGAQFVTTRAGWVIASMCGDHKILVAAETLQEAEQVNLERQARLSRLYRTTPCQRYLTVDPRGAIIAPKEQYPVGYLNGGDRFD